MQKPPPRPRDFRSSDNTKRRLRAVVPVAATLQLLAAEVNYRAYSKHKAVPRAFGLDPYTGPRSDETYCDAHAGFAPADMPKVQPWLQRGILAGLLGDNGNDDEPTLLWAPGDTGWLYEARITVPTQRLYHGYPVRPNEAIALDVIRRFELWVNAHGNAQDQVDLAELRKRYR